MKERIEHSLRLVVVINMVVGKPQLGTVSNTVRWPRTTTIRATVAARITMALAARVVLPANQAPVIMVMTQATIITRQRRPRWPSQALTMTVPMRRTDLRQQAMSTQTGSTTSTNCTAYAVLSEALDTRHQEGRSRQYQLSTQRYPYQRFRSKCCLVRRVTSLSERLGSGSLWTAPCRHYRGLISSRYPPKERLTRQSG